MCLLNRRLSYLVGQSIARYDDDGDDVAVAGDSIVGTVVVDGLQTQIRRSAVDWPTNSLSWCSELAFPTFVLAECRHGNPIWLTVG